VIPTLYRKLAGILACVGVSEGLSSLWELVEGLSGGDDELSQRRRTKRLAEWQNLSLYPSVGGSDELLLGKL